jgi:NAD(P)H-dependent FMN reductase
MPDGKPILKIVIASTRPGRAGAPVGDWIERLARDHGGFAVEVLDLADIALPFVDERHHPFLQQYEHDHTRAWSALVDEADAFVFVTPEYNYGFCAPLKNALDFLFFEWQYKPVGIVSYGGVSGGTRGVQMLKQVLDGLKLSPVFDNVYIPFVQELVADGRLNAGAIHAAAAEKMLDELVRMEDALRNLRSDRRAVAAG